MAQRFSDFGARNFSNVDVTIVPATTKCNWSEVGRSMILELKPAVIDCGWRLGLIVPAYEDFVKTGILFPDPTFTVLSLIQRVNQSLVKLCYDRAS